MGGGVAADRKGGARCALCGGAAAVHCAADAAFLCTRCDARVHGANFLASRHVRRRLTRAGAGGVSEASSCVSTADSAESTAAPATAAPVTGAGRNRKQRRRPPAEAVLEGWAKRMGLAPGAARRRAAASACTLRALGRGVAAARVPLRVAMAAALWAEVSATAGYGGKAALLCKLEATAHVPARLVLTVASWVARESHRPAPAADAEEGWAECC